MTQIKNGIMKHVNASVKSIVRVQKIIIGILAHVFVRMVGVSKLFLMIQKLCKIINAKDRRIVTNTIPKNMTDAIATNVMSTISIISHDKVRNEI